MSALKTAATYFVLLTIPLHSGAFYFRNLFTGKRDFQSFPRCYQDGYQIWRETVEVKGSLIRLTTEVPMVTLIFYLLSQDGLRRNHICVMNFATGTSYSNGNTCSWYRISDINYFYSIRLVASPDLNRTTIAFKPKMKNANWDYTSDLIIIHPGPVFNVHFDGLPADAKKCAFNVPVGKQFVVEFCVDNLKSPRVGVSWVNEPMAPKQDSCVVRTMSLTLGWDQLLLSYQDICDNVGSVICDVIDVTAPSNNTAKAPQTIATTAAPPGKIKWSMVTVVVPLVLIALLLLTGVVYAVKKFYGSVKRSKILEPLRTASKHFGRQKSDSSVEEVRSSTTLSDKHKSTTSLGRNKSVSKLSDRHKSTTSLDRVKSVSKLSDRHKSTTSLDRVKSGSKLSDRQMSVTTMRRIHGSQVSGKSSRSQPFFFS